MRKKHRDRRAELRGAGPHSDCSRMTPGATLWDVRERCACFQLFRPVIATDSTKYFCAAKKRTMHGSIQTTLAAIRSCASVVPYWVLKALSAKVSVRFSGLLR